MFILKWLINFGVKSCLRIHFSKFKNTGYLDRDVDH